MRLVSFVQVLLLLGIAAYLLLVTLENPASVRLPLPLGGGELTLSVGMAVSLFLLLGAAYAALLLLPPVWRERSRRRRDGRERERVEQRLTATLQARLGALPPAPAAPVAAPPPQATSSGPESSGPESSGPGTP